MLAAGTASPPVTMAVGALPGAPTRPRLLSRGAGDAANGPGAGSLKRVEAQVGARRDAGLNSRPAEALADEQAMVVALVDRSKAGDADAFGALYDRFQPEIVRYLAHRVGDVHAAEDLAQQVFLKAWQAIPRYEHRGVPFRAWLYRMAHNQMVDYFRSRRPTTGLDGVDVPEDGEAEERVLIREVHERLEQALLHLSEDHRRVLVLRFLMEKSAREIGEIMGRKEVTVRGLQMRALQALRREIELMGGLP
ncbi:MAG: sigma-70 family RNA polymerase sigma factor [Dehalococcoidia bacterium]|nr:sigma-70 family RNA polymerase sigma factor [Dehalococcoidia bacterium]